MGPTEPTKPDPPDEIQALRSRVKYLEDALTEVHATMAENEGGPNMADETGVLKRAMADGKLCDALGEHFWQESDAMLLSNPPQRLRTCRTCGKEQIGTPQPPIVWRDYPG